MNTYTIILTHFDNTTHELFVDQEKFERFLKLFKNCYLEKSRFFMDGIGIDFSTVKHVEYFLSV